MKSKKRPKLVLASRSPRRRELLTEAGYDFEVVVPDEAAECGVCSRETPEKLVARLARQKAANVVPRISSGLVLGCDTVAECCGQILGKPADEEHARQMLRMLSGRDHRVLSGLCLWNVPGCNPQIRIAVTHLRMDRLSDKEIDGYLASGLWEGKAGAFGYQDRLGWIRMIEGSETNVVGLPMELLAEMLDTWSE
ncbi:MAG: Maf family protein [Thermoguttaceae bacterium]